LFLAGFCWLVIGLVIVIAAEHFSDGLLSGGTHEGTPHSVVQHAIHRSVSRGPIQPEMSPPEAAAVPADPVSPGNLHSSHDPAAQNRPAPGVPPDGDHNQGGIRKEGLDYQRDLGSEQDALNRV